jgi:hypothetical protein
MCVASVGDYVPSRLPTADIYLRDPKGKAYQPSLEHVFVQSRESSSFPDRQRPQGRLSSLSKTHNSEMMAAALQHLENVNANSDRNVVDVPRAWHSGLEEIDRAETTMQQCHDLLEKLQFNSHNVIVQDGLLRSSL